MDALLAKRLCLSSEGEEEVPHVPLAENYSLAAAQRLQCGCADVCVCVCAP